MIENNTQLIATLDYIGKWADALEGMLRHDAERNGGVFPTLAAGPLQEIRANLRAARDFAHICSEAPARIESYKEIVKRIMDEYADFLPPMEGVELERIYDDARGHYELLMIGWEGHYRTHGMILHIDIKGDKIWVQHDGTEEGVAHDLVAAGVPKDHIVLAFHAPYKRKYTEYALG